MYPDQKKSLSHGDARNYQHRQATYSQDHRNGMNRQEPHSPYAHNYSQGHHHSHGHHQMNAPYQGHPRSPHHYNSHDYRSPQRSGPGVYRKSYVPSSPSKYWGQHYSSAPNHSRNNSKGIRKTNDQPQHSKQPHNNELKGAEPTKFIISKEKTVTFEDQKKNCSNESDAAAAPKVTSVLNTEVETNSNSIFNIEGGQNTPGDSNSADRGHQVETVITSTEGVLDEEHHVNNHNVSAIESSIVEQEIVVITSEEEKLGDPIYHQVPQVNHIAENSEHVNKKNDEQAVIKYEIPEENSVAKVCQSGLPEEYDPEQSLVLAEEYDTEQPESKGDERQLKQSEEHEPLKVALEIVNEELLQQSEENPSEQPLKQTDGHPTEQPLKYTEEHPTEKSIKLFENPNEQSVERSDEYSAEQPPKQVEDPFTVQLLKQSDEHTTQQSRELSFVIEKVENNESSVSLLLPEVANTISTSVNPDIEEETGEIFYPSTCSVEESVIQQADSSVVEPTPVQTSSAPELSASKINETAAIDGQEEIAVLKQQEDVSDDQLKHEDVSECQKLEILTPEPKKSPLIQKPGKQPTHMEEVTENLDALYITPVRASRKSRVLVDSTNIVESSSIKYVVREVKHKEKEASDVVVTPVRRSTRKKADTPGSAMKVADDEILTKAKVIPNPFLKT